MLSSIECDESDSAQLPRRPKRPFDSTQIDSADKLRDILDELQLRDPFILELEGDNGCRLKSASVVL